MRRDDEAAKLDGRRDPRDESKRDVSVRSIRWSRAVSPADYTEGRTAFLVEAQAGFFTGS